MGDSIRYGKRWGRDGGGENKSTHFMLSRMVSRRKPNASVIPSSVTEEVRKDP